MRSAHDPRWRCEETDVPALYRVRNGNRMGQNRNDTTGQTAAKRRTTERRRCPSCGRGLALVTVPDDDWFVQTCRWCDYDHATCLNCHQAPDKCSCW